MSSILKSLRKIEEKKRVSEHAAPDLTHDQGAGIAKANPFRPLLAGIALGAVMVGLLFYLFATPPAYISGPRPAAEPAALAATGQPARTATPNVQGQVETKPLPLANLAEKIPAAVQGSNPGSTVDAGQVPVVVLPPESIATSPARRAEPVLVKESKPAIKRMPEPERKISENAVKIADPRPVPKPVATTPAGPPALPDGVSLQLTEIFYQEDPASSLAVINDLPVMIGSQVDSAVIAEIRPDSVLVTIDGKVYTLAMTSP